jgi:uncharacterized protein (DUF427 family)
MQVRSDEEKSAMAKSPGHQQMPNHKVIEKHPREKFQVKVGGKVVAESADVIKVEEDGNPTRYYFPRSAVKMDLLDRTETTTKCPFKGTAHYYSLKLEDKGFDDAVWTYEEPYDEHRDLKDRLAFYEDKVPEMKIESMAA